MSDRDELAREVLDRWSRENASIRYNEGGWDWYALALSAADAILKSDSLAEARADAEFMRQRFGATMTENARLRDAMRGIEKTLDHHVAMGTLSTGVAVALRRIPAALAPTDETWDDPEPWRDATGSRADWPLDESWWKSPRTREQYDAETAPTDEKETK